MACDSGRYAILFVLVNFCQRQNYLIEHDCAISFYHKTKKTQNHMSEKSKSGWKQDPAAVKSDIIRVAISLFSANGLSGTRVEEIAAQTKTSKRMIYYYFGDKERLYAHCLEEVYSDIRDGEGELDLAGIAPKEALARLVSFTYDHQRNNPDFIRMVMIENIHNAEYLKTSDVIRDVNRPVIAKLKDIIARGVAAKEFREELDPVELHRHISALSFFNVSNKGTFSAIYGDALFSEEAQLRLRGQVVEMILNFVKA